MNNVQLENTINNTISEMVRYTKKGQFSLVPRCIRTINENFKMMINGKDKSSLKKNIDLVKKEVKSMKADYDSANTNWLENWYGNSASASVINDYENNNINHVYMVNTYFSPLYPTVHHGFVLSL